MIGKREQKRCHDIPRAERLLIWILSILDHVQYFFRGLLSVHLMLVLPLQHVVLLGPLPLLMYASMSDFCTFKGVYALSMSPSLLVYQLVQFVHPRLLVRVVGVVPNVAPPGEVGVVGGGWQVLPVRIRHGCTLSQRHSWSSSLDLGFNPLPIPLPPLS